MLAEAALIISFAGVGPVELGMTERQAERAAKMKIEPNLCGPDILGSDDGGIRLVFLDDRIVEIIVYDRRAGRTAEGVRVGDSLRQLRRAYPDGLRPLEIRPRWRKFALDSGRRRIRFMLNGKTRRIVRISSGWRRTGHPGWSCEQT